MRISRWALNVAVLVAPSWCVADSYPLANDFLRLEMVAKITEGILERTSAEEDAEVPINHFGSQPKRQAPLEARTWNLTSDEVFGPGVFVEPSRLSLRERELPNSLVLISNRSSGSIWTLAGHQLAVPKHLIRTDLYHSVSEHAPRDLPLLWRSDALQEVAHTLVSTTFVPLELHAKGFDDEIAQPSLEDMTGESRTTLTEFVPKILSRLLLAEQERRTNREEVRRTKKAVRMLCVVGKPCSVMPVYDTTP